LAARFRRPKLRFVQVWDSLPENERQLKPSFSQNPLLFISGTDPAKAQKNEQAFSMFNGRLDNGAVRVNPGDLVRMYFVNVGPGVSSAHVIGTVLDRVYDGRDPIYGVQTYAVPAGSGAMLEFYIPEEGVYPFVDHDKLAFLSYGLALPFATANVDA
jgi:hypothetical protein